MPTGSRSLDRESFDPCTHGPAACVHEAELCAACFHSLLVRFDDVGEDVGARLVGAGTVDYDVDGRRLYQLDVGGGVLD